MFLNICWYVPFVYALVKFVLYLWKRNLKVTPVNDGRYLILHDMDLKSGPRKKNTETQVRAKKDILTKVTKDSVRVSIAYYPGVSNIDSRVVERKFRILVWRAI